MKLNAPDSAAGKKGRCPKCSATFVVPEPVQEAEPVAPDFGLQETPGSSQGVGDLLDEMDDYPLATGPPAASAPAAAAGEGAGEPRRPCPMCGEMILTGAVKCRYCGEVFDPALKKKEKKRKKSYGTTDDDDTLGTGDWLLAILCSGIGCIIGIIWLIQGKPKAGKMIGVSLLFAFLWNVIRFAIEMAAHAP